MENAKSEDEARDEFLLLFSRERMRIYAFVYSLVPIEADAEDVFQQVSLVLWKRFTEFDPAKSFFSWACGVVAFTVMNYRRGKSRSKVIFSDELVSRIAEERINWGAEDSVRMEALKECIAHLRDDDRTLVTQFYGEGVVAKEIANKTGRSVHMVYRHLSLIRKRLVTCVSGKLAAGHKWGPGA